MHRFVQISLGLFAAFTVVFALTRSEDARASVGYTSPYTYEQTYGTALRLLRVDMGLSIREKDKDLGYVLFDYKSPESGDRIHNGAIELVRLSDGVQVAVQLPAMPSYHERMLVDALAKKLESEYGTPPKRDKKRDADKSKDKGDKDKGDGDKDADKGKGGAGKDGPDGDSG
jgi:hypothetical protein